MHSDRLRKNKEFRLVYKKGKVYWSNYFILRCLKRQDSGKTRIGIAPSRKVRTAVERNKIKRRVRELYRQYKCLIKEGNDLIVNIKITAIDVDFAILEKDFKYLLKKSGLI